MGELEDSDYVVCEGGKSKKARGAIKRKFPGPAGHPLALRTGMLRIALCAIPIADSPIAVKRKTTLHRTQMSLVRTTVHRSEKGAEPEDGERRRSANRLPRSRSVIMIDPVLR